MNLIIETLVFIIILIVQVAIWIFAYAGFIKPNSALSVLSGLYSMFVIAYIPMRLLFFVLIRRR
jgi:hypothetical protein